MSDADAKPAIDALGALVSAAITAAGDRSDAAAEGDAIRELDVRAKKLASAWGRPQCLGFFGPSQAGKSFLVGALLSHELGSLQVLCGARELDFLKEINPAKGVESTGVVTRFSTRPAPPLTRGDFSCQLLGLDAVLESMATGFLVECTSPAVDPAKVDACLRDARAQVQVGASGGSPAAIFRAAWDATWHSLGKKYQDRHPYLNELRRHPALAGRDGGAWKNDIKSPAGWLLVMSLLWGGPGYAPDLDALARVLVQGLDLVGHAPRVEVGLEHVRAASEGASVIDAACLNSLGVARSVVKVYAPDAARDVAIEPGVLSALISEIRLPLRAVPGSLLDRADILDFPGGRALKGINGFGPTELGSGRLENAIEVYKRGKLTFLFERYALDREITSLVLCSPGPTKPEAVQLQTQVEGWLKIRHGGPVPANEIDQPTLFMALTKYDMSLGALRSDNAKDRWDSRVQEACVDFWARSQKAWIVNYGADGKPFTNMFWIRNPYADQMRSLRPDDADYETIKAGYFQSRAVQKHMAAPEEKWAAVEGEDAGGLPRSGVPLLATRLKERLAEDIKARELLAEARGIQAELVSWLRAMTPSKDESEERARLLENARLLVSALRKEMSRRCSGAVFGEFMRALVADEVALEAEVRKAYAAAAPMSIKTSDKVKKVLVHTLKWWKDAAAARLRDSGLALPGTIATDFVRQVCTSKRLMPVLGNAVFPYFSRSTVDTALVARIVLVKVSDAFVDLFAERPRKTPEIPVRLSFAEAIAAPGAAEEKDAIDWGDVDFSDEPASPKSTEGVEIVFAGGGHFAHWSEKLADFYLATAGGQALLAAEDPRVAVLVRTLQGAEAIDLRGPGGGR